MNKVPENRRSTIKIILEVEPEIMVVVQQIDGGSAVKLHPGAMGIKEGNEIRMISKEGISPAVHGTGTYIMAEVEGIMVTTGAGVSEKIRVNCVIGSELMSNSRREG